MTDRAPSVALVACIQDEEMFLPAFLAYHHALGVSRAYIYMDRCTDRSRAIVASFPWAIAIDRDCPAGEGHLTLHQISCADDALLRARADGMDWLMQIDPDEFAWGGELLPKARSWFSRRKNGNLADQGSLVRLAAAARPETEMIRLKSAEVLPVNLQASQPFWRQSYFQLDGAVSRPVLDPATNTVRTLDRWIGHNFGKCLVRTACDVQAFTSHEWTRHQHKEIPDNLPLATEERGFLLHYVVTSAAHWRQKYQRLSTEPRDWLRGSPVPFPKQSWKEASMRMTEDEASEYYCRWVAVPEQLLRSNANIRRITLVEDILGAIHK